MNPLLTTRLRHLRLSGMVDALPGRVAQAEAAPLRISSFLNYSSRTSSRAAPIASLLADSSRPASSP
jgi:hypothetical protein